MKLRVEKGPAAGKNFDLESPLLTIGRAKDNDIVIQDEMISHHHAKIWRDLDGKVSVTDMDSVNGTEVNGRLVQTAELRLGDRLVFGKTVMRVVEEQVVAAEEKAKAPPPPEKPKVESKKPAPDAAIDLGFEKKESETPLEEERSATPQRFSKKLVVVVFCALAAVAVALAIKLGMPKFQAMFKGGEPPSRQVHVPSVTVRTRTELYYEYVEGSSTGPVPNVRRYEIVLKASKLAVLFDDLKEGIRVSKQKDLSASELAEFLGGIKFDELFKLEKEYIGQRVANTISEMDLRMTRGADYHRVYIRNMLPPDVIVILKRNIEDFIKDNMGVVFIPRQKRIDQAQQAFEKAERDYAAMAVHPANLYSAVKSYGEAVMYLSELEPKPPLFEVAKEKGIKASEELNNKVDWLFQQANIKKNISNWRGAEQDLSMILQMIPDPRDPRRERAHEERIRVQINLQKP